MSRCAYVPNFQAYSLPDDHSLHVTVSSGQANSWADLLEKLVPKALQLAIANEPDLRRSLPRDYLQYMGVAQSRLGTESDPRRKRFLAEQMTMLAKVFNYVPVDFGAEEMAKKFIHDALPPVMGEGGFLGKIFRMEHLYC